MKREWIVLAGIAVAGLISFPAYRAFERHRDLSETLAWIDQTYNPHEGGDNWGQGHGWEKLYTPNGDKTDSITEEYQTTIASDGGCNIKIRSETHPIGVWQDMPSVGTYSFDLRDIDPSSITIQLFDPHNYVFSCQDPEQVKNYNLDCTSGELVFLTRNAAPAIREDYVRTFTKLTGAEHEQRNTSRTQKMWLLVDDANYGQRLARAWKHAIELCGGKSSKF